MAGERLSKERARRLLDALALLAGDDERGVFLGDEQGCVAWVNDAGVRLSGIPREKLIGGPPKFRLYDPEHPEGAESEISPLDPDTPVRCVLHTLDADAKPSWIDVEILRTERRSGTPGGFVVVAADVTRRRKAEAALAESEERYHGLVDLCPDPIAVHDGEKLLYANLAATAMLGASAPGELVGRPVMDFVHPDSRDEVAERIRKLQEVGEPMPLVEHTLCRLDGRELEVETAATLITWSGAPAVQVVARDVTERNRNERERRRREAQARESQHLDSLGRLAAGIAHDFNNVLATILGNADFLFADLGSSSPLREPLQDIRSAATRASRLTEEILSFAEGGQLEPRSLDLSSLLIEMSNLVDTAVSKKVSVSYDLSGQLPRIQGDPVQLRRALLNLILNASEAAGNRPGTISVRAGVRVVDAEYLARARPSAGVPAGRYVAVEIRDQNGGMDSETRARAFEPFYSTKQEGRGLGLPAALGVVRSHGGAIHIDTQPGTGTIVTVLLPADPRMAGIVREEAARTESPASVEEHAGATILVADDEPGVRRMAVRILERAGFRVITARDGTEAVEVFHRRARRIGAVVLDLTMPGLSGDEVFERIREAAPDLPVLFSSGFSRSALSSRVSGRARTGFIAKPYEAQALIDSLLALLED